MTGVEITLNVLAEFIGGSWVEGNALAMNYFKCFGYAMMRSTFPPSLRFDRIAYTSYEHSYVTCAHAVWFANDLKLAHYVKIPPRQTFWAQTIATIVSTLVCVGILNFQMNQIPGVCTKNQPDHYTCPGINTFFTASVLWGTIGPKKVFGSGGQYTALLIGWPIGLLLPLFFWALQRRFPRALWMRQIHPVVMLYGMIYWAPYNLSYVIPSVPIAYFSWIWLKNRHLAFWSKYNFVLSASFSSGIGIAAIIMFFGLQWKSQRLSWWGNDVVSQGCEDEACTLFTLGEGEHFGPGPGQFH